LNVLVRSGVWVTNVVAGAPADKAGVKQDDVITEFGGIPIRADDLQGVVEQLPVGTVRTLKVIRDGKPLALEVVLEPLADSAEIRSRERGRSRPSPKKDNGKD
jgi:serine protease Do